MQMVKIAFDERELKNIKAAAEEQGVSWERFIRQAAVDEADIVIDNKELDRLVERVVDDYDGSTT